jgi:hypothetical protein
MMNAASACSCCLDKLNESNILQMVNVFIERLWRSVKYEGVYLWAPQTVHELEMLLEKWFLDYNQLKPH